MIPLMPQGVEHDLTVIITDEQKSDDSIDAARR